MPPSGSFEAHKLWQSAAYIRVEVSLHRRLNDKDNVVFRFKRRDDGPVGSLVRDGLFVDFGDDGALAEADLICEGAGPNAGDDDTALSSGLCCNGRRDGRDSDAKEALSGVGLLRCGGRIVAVAARYVGEGFGAVDDGNVGSALFAVTEIAKFDGGTNFTRGDVCDEIVAILDGAAVDGDDDIPGLETGFCGSAIGGDCADDDSVGEAVHAVDGGVEVGLVADADGATDDLVLRPDEHVVDRGDGVRRHGETDTLRAHGLGVDGGVHADDLTGHIDERAA